MGARIRMMRIKMKGASAVWCAAAVILAIVPRIRIIVYFIAYEIFRLILQNSNNITVRAANQKSTLLRSVLKNNFDYEIKSRYSNEHHVI